MGILKNRFFSLLLVLLLAISFVPNFDALAATKTEPATVEKTQATSKKTTYTAPAKKRVKTKLSKIPEYSGEEYYVLHNNIPYFTKSTISTESKEKYGKLDKLGRCTECFSVVGLDIMPTEKRGSISSVKPSGWKQAQYDCVNGKSLYNRCHLIGYQLTAENANKKNLITGTRYLNEAMIPFENMVADYIKETGNHVLYRVRCLYNGDDLVARGIIVEAWSVEDNGEGICFNVFFYNVQPGVVIDYSDGSSCLEENKKDDDHHEDSHHEDDHNEKHIDESEEICDYIANAKTKVLHKTDCSSVKAMSEKNKVTLHGRKSEFVSDGYTPCKNCMN